MVAVVGVWIAGVVLNVRFLQLYQGCGCQALNWTRCSKHVQSSVHKTSGRALHESTAISVNHAKVANCSKCYMYHLIYIIRSYWRTVNAKNAGHLNALPKKYTGAVGHECNDRP